MEHLIFLRHGQAVNNIERILAGRTKGIPLTDEGQKQAEYAANLLKSANVSAIYSSPIQRSVDTANIIGKVLSLDVIKDERLTEIDMGKFTGMKYDKILVEHGNVFLKFYRGELEIAHMGVETFVQVKKRITEMIDTACTKHPGGTILFITHMDPIKAVLSGIINVTPETMLYLDVANAALNVFVVSGTDNNNHNKLTLRAFNVMHPSRFASDTKYYKPGGVDDDDDKDK